MFRVLLFAGTGAAFFALWFITGPSGPTPESMIQWPNVLWFSATLLALAFAIAAFGQMVGGRWVIRLATVAAAGVTLSSVANIVEDGFRVEAGFYAFILGLLILELGLAGLTLAILRLVPGPRKLLAVTPAATMAGMLLFVRFGGPLLLVAWLAASAAAVASRRLAPEVR